MKNIYLSLDNFVKEVFVVISKSLIFVLVFLVSANFYIWNKFDNQDTSSKIIFLDIGQGDATLIKTKQNKFALIDCGPGSNIIYEIEKYLPVGFKEFEFVILTHPDLDHIEGTLEILKSYGVKKIFFNTSAKDNDLVLEIKNKILEKNIENYGFYEVNDFNFDEFEFDILWPVDGFYEYPDSNDNSIAFILKFGKNKIYFGGDLAASPELESVKNIETDIDILKVSHHGSRFSTSFDFVNKLKPEIAVISAGENNSYGHPSSQVIDMLNSFNTIVRRTDWEGSICYKFSYISYNTC